MKNFKEWLEDNSRIENFKDTVFYGNVALVEVYREPLEHGIQTDIVVGYGADQKPFGLKAKVEAQIKPIAKVLQIGNALADNYKDLKPGSIVRIPSSVKNEVPHPDYLTLLQTQKSNMEPKLPKGLNKYTTRFSHVWKDWMYPEDPFSDLTTLDTVTYLVPLNPSTIQSDESNRFSKP